MRLYLVEVNCLLFEQQRLVLCLAVVSMHCQHRFTTFPFNSPCISNCIQSNTYYLHASRSGATYSFSNYFIRINVKEIFIQQHFFYVFFNGKKNASEFFCIKMEMHFFILFFQICSKADGYLFIITITTYTIVTTIARPAVFITPIHYANKNFFHLCQKWVIFDYFLMGFLEYLVVLQLILMWFMIISKILLSYHYVFGYHLYQNIEVLYISTLYNSYKNINKTTILGQKFCKSIWRTGLCITTAV